VSDFTIRPTAKFLKLGTILAGIVFIALEYGCITSWNDQAGSQWIMILPALVWVWPAERALARRLTTTTITGDRLRYETGALSKSTRTIQLSKLQDVRVDQRLMQRVFNVGNLSLETAGEASRLSIHNVDQPQALADEILNRAQKGATSL
jgi:uncharacterized membrane protein YdbT with pleckstrin-like domain